MGFVAALGFVAVLSFVFALGVFALGVFAFAVGFAVAAGFAFAFAAGFAGFALGGGGVIRPERISSATRALAAALSRGSIASA